MRLGGAASYRKKVRQDERLADAITYKMIVAGGGGSACEVMI